MPTCDVAVIGLGIMGSAALDALLRRGVDAIGFDPLPLGAATNSSHGSCRAYRRFNFESDAYTALSDEAHDGWRALEAASGETILKSSPVLAAGPPGSPVVLGSREAAERVGVTSPIRTGAEANERFPAFNLPGDWETVLQEGGILLIEAALRAYRAASGSRIVAERVRLEPAADGIHVRTAGGDWRANKVILATGPWIAELVPGLRQVVTVTRQTVGWFRPSRPEAAAFGSFPVFIIADFQIDSATRNVYGFPDFEGRGVKAALHDHGPVVGPDDWTPPASDAELADVAATLSRYIPGAFGPITERDVCLYANTAPADLAPDAGEEFILDRLPADRRIIVASPCSGHGAKFAPAIGEILARLAVEDGFEADPAFRLGRYSGF